MGLKGESIMLKSISRFLATVGLYGSIRDALIIIVFLAILFAVQTCEFAELQDVGTPTGQPHN